VFGSCWYVSADSPDLYERKNEIQLNLRLSAFPEGFRRVAVHNDFEKNIVRAILRRSGESAETYQHEPNTGLNVLEKQFLNMFL